MRKTVLIVMAAMLVVGAGCGSSGSSSSAQTRRVDVDGKADTFNAAFLAYFPNTVTARPGDTVEFKSIWRGEPHTVTMGTLVEAGLKAAQAQGPNASGPPPAAFAKLPTLFPQGQGDANQNAAQPCFLATGEPPSDPKKPCPKQTAQPDFNGKQTYYNSGFMPEGDVFKVKLAADTAPGSYHYYCNLHGPSMSGTIDVKAKDAKIPSAADVDKAGKAERDAVIKKLQPAYDMAKAGQFPIQSVSHVAGFGSQDVDNAFINEFLPPVKAKVGEKVSWAFVGFHTVSFNAPDKLKNHDWLTKAADGSVHIDQAAFTPAGGPGFTGPNPGPPNGPPNVKVVDGGKYDGTGFRSSSVSDESFPPNLVGFSLTFTKPGSYSYTCVIHPGMDGVVQVT